MKNPWPVVLGLLAVLAVGGVAGVFLAGRDPAPVAAAPEPAPAATAETAFEEMVGRRVKTGRTTPTRDWYGLTFGTSGEAEISAWVAARGLDCPVSPNPKHMTRRWQCRGGLDKLVLEGRPAQGPLFDLVIARPDEGALHFIKMTRRYSWLDGALADYNALVALLTTTLGEPSRAKPAPPRLEGDPKMLAYSTAWKYDDLDVEVTATRVMVDYVAVTEVWSVPGIEPTPTRARSPFEGKPNPHIKPDDLTKHPEGDAP